MSLTSRIAKLFRRRNRRKGVMVKHVNRRGRNRMPETAVDLWQRVYRFKETPPARAGEKRAQARLQAKMKAQNSTHCWIFRRANPEGQA